MIASPCVKFSGQSLTTLDDEALLQLILRNDLPGYLMDLYADEADRGMATLAQQEVTR
jgi:hypothetical protein